MNPVLRLIARFASPLRYFSIFLLSFVGMQSCLFEVRAASYELPFTDVAETDDYYSDLVNLYQRGIIADNPSKRFNPNSLMNRDDFVAIVVGVSCKNCLSPSFEDILKYTALPFTDFERKNQNFYCVSYAKEKGIVEWYVTGTNGTTSCQDGKTYSETPFCAYNKITRIEAAAVLLRQAGLWNNSLNSGNFERKLTLPDTPESWYGYAQKAIQIGIITPDSQGKIRPDENITRREFVRMAANVFRTNLCALRTDVGVSQLSSEVRVLDAGARCATSTPVTSFPNPTGTQYTFFGRTENTGGPFEYTWDFARVQDGKRLSGKGECLPLDLGGAGTWLVRLTLREPSTGKTSQSLAAVEVQDWAKGGKGLSLEARASVLNTAAPYTVQFNSTLAGWVGPFTYRWDFKDGGYSSEVSPVHTFTRTGVMPVTLTVRDSQGTTAVASVTLVFENSPDIDGDGALNESDSCPLVFGAASNAGCPVVPIYDSVTPQPGSTSAYVPNWGLTLPGVGGQCLYARAKERGVLFGQASCTSCPCQYSIDFVSEMRACDVVFPAIMSPDKKTILSRGKVFEVQ